MSAIGKLHAGQRVGWLTLRRVVGHSEHGDAIWECTCECGGTVNRRAEPLYKALRRGNNAGCGPGCGMRACNRLKGCSNAPVDWGSVLRQQAAFVAKCRRGHSRTASAAG